MITKMISGLYPAFFYYFPFNTRVRRLLASTEFNTCRDHVPGRMSKKSGCEMSFEAFRITDLIFVNDAFVSAETTEIRTAALESVSEETKPFRLSVLLIKPKVQTFRDILDATTESIPVSGENVQVTQTFTYLPSVIYLSPSFEQLRKRTKVRVFRSQVVPDFLYSCETWTLTGELKR